MAAADGVDVDCLVVGGGPGGLMTAVYLARFRRNVIVVDAGESRARWIPESHNLPGFPEGLSGTALVDRLERQAVHYGATLARARIAAIERSGGRFVADTDAAPVRARTVVLATGVKDRLPDIPDLFAAMASGRVRLCPVCDGFEAIGRSICVYGPLDRALPEAIFLKTFTGSVTLAHPDGFGEDEVGQVRRAGLVALPVPVRAIRPAGHAIELALADGTTAPFDTLYPALGLEPASALARSLGVGVNASGCVETDRHQRTAADGVYAVGDVVSTLNQIAVAVGQAAIAGTDIHNRLKG